jgi:hypothetical protein
MPATCDMHHMNSIMHHMNRPMGHSHMQWGIGAIDNSNHATLMSLEYTMGYRRHRFMLHAACGVIA